MKLGRVVTVAAVLVAVGLFGGSARSAGTAPRAVRAAADAYVVKSKPTTNFGRAKTLSLGPPGRERAYVVFDLRSQSVAIVRAKLRLYAPRASRNGVVVRAVRDPIWNEREITFATAPAVGARVAVFKRVRRGWNTVDVTRYARGKPLLSVALASRRGTVKLSSREGGRAAQLVVVVKRVPAATIVAAGDIAGCDTAGDEATAAVVQTLPGTVAALGDLVYEDGTAAAFANCYAPSWGAFKARTRPATGNHEYHDPGAAGYFGYFGSAAGEPGKGYYSYDLGAWHVVVLNSNCDVVPCGAGSAQLQWLQSDLAANPRFCTLAYWHHPRFSSGHAGNSVLMGPLWAALYDAQADLVLVGHDHDYERFAPMGAAGQSDPSRGIREFVVGTGGRSHVGFQTIASTSEVRNSDTFGVLRLALGAAGYSFRFVPVAGGTFSDSGSGVCH